MDEELENFKQIDLREFAASVGYQLDERKSSRGNAVMRNLSNDKIIIKCDTDGHYVYFSPRDDRDHGTIIDFIQKRRGLNLGQARKELRRFAESASSLPRFQSPLERTEKDRMAVTAAYARMKAISRHPYLERDRLIPAQVLSDRRFEGRIRIDGRGNAVFPHYDELGLCGFEIKNQNFTGFSTGGTKGLWLSRRSGGDGRLVFAESAIDALSYAALFPSAATRYASIGGKPNPKQPDFIMAEIKRLQPGSIVIAAMDNDTDGRLLAEIVRTAGAIAGNDFVFHLHLPEKAKDWNDVLKNGHLSFPTAQSALNLNQT